MRRDIWVSFVAYMSVIGSLNHLLVTEDYSEYESVDEEEPAEEPTKAKKPVKAKASGGSEGSSKSKLKAEESVSEKEPRKVLKPGLKRSGSSGSKVAKKGSLMNFFGKK